MTGVEHLRDLAEKATQGPRSTSGVAITVYGRGTVATCPQPNYGGVLEFVANAAFIAACDPQTILSLLDENERLVAALEPFANQAGTFDSDGAEFVPDEFEPAIVTHTIGDLRRARAAHQESRS